MLTTLALIPVLASIQAQPVKLSHAFVKGEKLQYDLKSTINAESRGKGLETWIPEDFDIQYQFTTEVLEMKPDGIVDMKYLRPSITEIEGETAESPPKSTVDKVGFDLILTVSPVNDILKIKDQSKKEPEKKQKPPVLALSRLGAMRPIQLDILGQFIGEIHRLALFLGPLDGSMDFAPKLPFDEVKPGDTWKKTVGYSPQTLKGKGNKLAVQRLDYTYTYQGPVMNDKGKQIQRVTADLQMKTDLAAFVHQIFEVKPEDTGLKEIPIQFKGHIDFDLDPKTFKTLRAVGTSQGGFKIVLTDYPNEPVEEENFKGRTILKLLNP